jgi:hypothetical protein
MNNVSKEIDSVLAAEENERIADEYNNKLLRCAQGLENKMGCCCDLDNWQPETSTGHSWVCRIHKAAIAMTPLSGDWRGR